MAESEKTGEGCLRRSQARTKDRLLLVCSVTRELRKAHAWSCARWQRTLIGFEEMQEDGGARVVEGTTGR